jgi:hypothetical protein
MPGVPQVSSNRGDVAVTISDDKHIGPVAQDVERRFPGSTELVNGHLHLKR